MRRVPGGARFVEVLAGLGRMYAGGGDMTETIDRAGEDGNGEFMVRAITPYA